MAAVWVRQHQCERRCGAAELLEALRLTAARHTPQLCRGWGVEGWEAVGSVDGEEVACVLCAEP